MTARGGWRFSRGSVPSADLLAIVSLAGTICLFFWKLCLTNLILARGDTLFYIYPYWSAAASALRSGRLALWNPDLFMGAPMLANSQAGLLYPLNWPLWWWFDVPVAAKISILLHLCIAATLTYGLARDVLHLRRPAAWLAAALFALGGYLTAQVEHINQLQGFAWMPAVFWLLARQTERSLAPRLGLVLALQILAGHTQAAFITVVGAGLFGGWLSLAAGRARRPSFDWSQLRSWLRLPIARLLGAGLIAILLTMAQILPTLELSRQSVRGGGLPLNEAVSFSLHPLLLGRALLPGYGETLFSEYVAMLPLSVLALVMLGAWTHRRRPAVVAMLLVTASGLFFALGRANPIYLALVRLAPGFDLFRAPARWLALYGLGMGVLAGAGLDVLLSCQPWAAPALDQRLAAGPGNPRRVVLAGPDPILAGADPA